MLDDALHWNHVAVYAVVYEQIKADVVRVKAGDEVRSSLEQAAVVSPEEHFAELLVLRSTVEAEEHFLCGVVSPHSGIFADACYGIGVEHLLCSSVSLVIVLLIEIDSCKQRTCCVLRCVAVVLRMLVLEERYGVSKVVLKSLEAFFH